VLATSQLVNHLSIAPTFSRTTDLVYSLESPSRGGASHRPAGARSSIVELGRRDSSGLNPRRDGPARGRCERMRLRKTGSREVTGRRSRLAGPRVASKMAKWLPADRLAVE
jgi:hypothetical protein